MADLRYWPTSAACLQLSTSLPSACLVARHRPTEPALFSKHTVHQLAPYERVPHGMVRGRMLNMWPQAQQLIMLHHSSGTTSTPCDSQCLPHRRRITHVAPLSIFYGHHRGPQCSLISQESNWRDQLTRAPICCVASCNTASNGSRGLWRDKAWCRRHRNRQLNGRRANSWTRCTSAGWRSS